MTVVDYFGYFLREVLRHWKMQPVVAAAVWMTVFSLLSIGGCLTLALLNIESWTQTFSQQVHVVAFLEDAKDPQKRRECLNKIQQVPHVRDVRYISKDEAFQALQKHLHDSVTTKDLGGNPLRDRLDIAVESASYVAQVGASLEKIVGVAKVRSGGIVVEQLVKLGKMVGLASLAFNVVLLACASTVIGNSIRLSTYARRDEIEVMQMLGAEAWFVRVPFLLDSLLLSLSASAVSLLWLMIGYNNLGEWVTSTVEFLQMVDFSSLVGWLSGYLFGVGVTTSVTSSYFSLNRYLKV